MKVGIGIRYQARSSKDFLDYAAQIGANHGVLFLPDETILPGANTAPWTVEALNNLKKFYAQHNMKIEGFENFDPKQWYKVLLDMSGKQEQMDYLKYCVTNMGKAGIKVMGYNFSMAGVTGLYKGQYCRGNAEAERFTLSKAPINEPFPLGWAWNRHVLPEITEGHLPPIPMDEWMQRRDWFLSELIPVAEEAGVKMGAHPEDPPIPVMKTMPRILTSQQAYDEMFAKFPSPSNGIEFCQGVFTEMGVNVYDAIKYFGNMDKIAYVHFRNVVGNIPQGEYTEVFIDEGDVDMVEALKAYNECGYTGLLMPDHTPSITCDNPTETGMAYAIGYIRGVMKALGIYIED